MPKSLPTPIIVFDFDGTIAKTDELMLTIYNQIAPSLSLKSIDHQEVQSIREMSTKDALKRLKVSWYKMPTLWRQMTNALSLHSKTIPLQEGMANILYELSLKKVPFGIISSNSVANIEAVFAHNTLPEPLFIGSSSALFKKHKVYKKLFKLHHLNVQQSLYVGDETRDIELGKKLSIPVLSVSWGFASKKSLLKAGATRICDSTETLETEIKHFLESFLN